MYTIGILFVCDWHQRLLFLGNPSETPWKPLGNPLETLRKPLGTPLVHNDPEPYFWSFLTLFGVLGGPEGPFRRFWNVSDGFEPPRVVLGNDNK